MKKTSPCTVKPEEAAELLGISVQTLYGNLREGFYSDIGCAKKTGKHRECYTYEVWKFPLCQRLGLDVNLSIEEILELVRQGKPPFIKQSPLSEARIRAVVADAVEGVIHNIRNKQMAALPCELPTPRCSEKGE